MTRLFASALALLFAALSNNQSPVRFGLRCRDQVLEPGHS